MAADDTFKICPMCNTEWKTRDIFFEDNTVEIIGYAADFRKLELGLFYFTHTKKGCYSTFALRVDAFLNMYAGTKFTERRTGKEECPGFCLDENQLNRCDAFCECAFNREIIQIIKQRQNAKKTK